MREATLTGVADEDFVYEYAKRVSVAVIACHLAVETGTSVRRAAARTP